MPSQPLYDFTVSLFPASLRASVPPWLLSWQPGLTPLSTATGAGSTIGLWLFSIFAGCELLKHQPALSKSLKYVFFLHNVLLSVGSGWLLALMLEEIIPIWRRNGAFYAICGAGAWTSHLETFYIINYYFKYYELVDTVFLVLKKKPLAFLHVYHHSATALLCLVQLHGKTSVSWVVISLNLFVHLVMYGYYAATAINIRVPNALKRSVTSLQITQFVIDLWVVFYASWSHFANARWGLGAYTNGDCAGTEYAAAMGMGVLSSYLFLFIGFYQRTYAARSAAKRARAAGDEQKRVAAKQGKAQ